MSKDPGEHPSHYVWGDFLAEARAAREDPPPSKLECFEGGYDKGYGAGLAASGANEAVPEPPTDSTVLIDHLRRAINAGVFGIPAEAVPDLQAKLTELGQRVIRG